MEYERIEVRGCCELNAKGLEVMERGEGISLIGDMSGM